MQSSNPFTSKSTLELYGTWACLDDLKPKGELSGLGVARKACVFGIPIDVSEYSTVLFAYDNLQSLIRLRHSGLKFYEPRSVYHGSHRENARSILSRGLDETDGMLGPGVYTGTFWKAIRFGCFTKDYFSRPGVIFKLYAFWRSPLFRTLDNDCTCGCDFFSRRIADHNGVWRIHHDAIIVMPLQDRDGTYFLKNEEYACFANTLTIESYGFASVQVRDPLERNITID